MSDNFDLTYNQGVLKLIRHPKNMGEIKDANGIGIVGNPVCGDIMKIYIKVKKNQDGEEFIQDIKFQTLGCGAAIANSSILTVVAKGKTLKEAKKISKATLVKALGGLPPIKIHCSVLAHQALEKAINNYHKHAFKKS